MLEIAWKVKLERERKVRARPPVIAGHSVLQVFHYEKGSFYESTLVAFDIETGGERWRAAIPHVANEPIVGPDGSAYVSSFEGALYALDVEGRPRWRSELGKHNLGMPAFAGPRRILVAETGGRGSRTWCLSAANGDVLWSFENGGHSYAIAATPTLAVHATAVSGSNFGETTIRLFALAVDTGRPIWTNVHDQYLFMPVLVGDHAVVGARGAVIAYRLTDGRPAAHLPLDVEVAAHIVVAGDAGLMILDDQNVLRLCTLTRNRSLFRSSLEIKQVWTNALPAKAVGRPTELHSHVAVMSEGGALHLFTSSNDGAHVLSIENKGGATDGAGGLARCGDGLAAAAGRELRLLRWVAPNFDNQRPGP